MAYNMLIDIVDITTGTMNSVSKVQWVQAAVDILMDRLADPDTNPRRVALDGPLILRGSARIPDEWPKGRTV